MKLTVGQKLWFVRSDNARTQSEVTVEKIGRKWATLSNRLRIDIDSLIADGGEYSPPGTAWVNRETYEARIELRKAWRQSTYRLRATLPPKNMTLEKIAQMEAILEGVLFTDYCKDCEVVSLLESYRRSIRAVSHCRNELRKLGVSVPGGAYL